MASDSETQDLVLACPACGMQYLVATDALGEEGRKVRCASCGHGWHQEPVTAPEQELDSRIEPEPEPDHGSEPEPVAKRPSRLRTGVLAAVLVSMGVGGVAVLGAGDQPATATPLELKVERRSDVAQRNGENRLSISGQVLNRSATTRDVPDIHAEIHDATGTVVRGWTIPTPTHRLGPNASASFDSTDVVVPSGAKALSLSFDGDPVR